GNVGIGDSAPSSKLSVSGTIVGNNFVGTTTATSTFGGGIDIATGCFAMNGTCLTQGLTAAITSLNGQTGASQTFATSTSGNDFSITSAGNIHTFNLPFASATANGKLSSTDWT